MGGIGVYGRGSCMHGSVQCVQVRVGTKIRGSRPAPVFVGVAPHTAMAGGPPGPLKFASAGLYACICMHMRACMYGCAHVCMRGCIDVIFRAHTGPTDQ